MANPETTAAADEHAEDIMERLTDSLGRHKSFVKRLRAHLDGFLGDLPVNAAALRKLMEEEGV